MAFKDDVLDFLTAFTGMRKTLVMFGILIIGVSFRLANLIDGAQMVDLLKGTTLGFLASNSIEHVGLTIQSFVNKSGKKVEEIVPENAKNGQ